ncbi:hypothetical protein KJA13_00830 [Patescibacteria group bacterium]|nr:hypothetical protein [Patescibacteria group bacterium]
MNFNYQKICADLLKGLPQRTTGVIERRFGLQTGQRETLEAIGESYGRTRERIRQIEDDGISKIKPRIKENQKLFKYFEDILTSFGGLKKEDDLLQVLGGNKFQSHIFFLLSNGDDFNRFPEDNDFYSFWAIKKESVNQAKKVVELTINRFKKEKRTFSLNELLKNQKLNKDIFLSYIGISKQIQKNPEEQYGLKDWLEINPRGVKDRAYLVFKREEKPLHFAQVATLIEKLPFPCQKGIHIATVHNELIKDPRFVLVGRGLYALTEWGYTPGVVKDIISKILKESKKPLSKKEVLERVLEQRFVKENTVSLNLQNNDCFVRDSQGRYKVREA